MRGAFIFRRARVLVELFGLLARFAHSGVTEVRTEREHLQPRRRKSIQEKSARERERKKEEKRDEDNKETVSPLLLSLSPSPGEERDYWGKKKTKRWESDKTFLPERGNILKLTRLQFSSFPNFVCFFYFFYYLQMSERKPAAPVG